MQAAGSALLIIGMVILLGGLLFAPTILTAFGFALTLGLNLYSFFISPPSTQGPITLNPINPAGTNSSMPTVWSVGSSSITISAKIGWAVPPVTGTPAVVLVISCYTGCAGQPLYPVPGTYNSVVGVTGITVPITAIAGATGSLNYTWTSAGGTGPAVYPSGAQFATYWNIASPGDTALRVFTYYSAFGDFSITASPNSFSNLAPGATATSTLTFSSLGGWSGQIGLAVNGPGSLSKNSTTLTSGSVATVSLVISSLNAGAYTIIVTATSGIVSHQVSVAAAFTLPSSPTGSCSNGGTYPNCNPPPCTYGGVYPSCNPAPTTTPGSSTSSAAYANDWFGIIDQFFSIAYRPDLNLARAIMIVVGVAFSISGIVLLRRP